MGSWALGFDHGTKAQAAGLAASTDLVALSGGSSNNTKGAWTQLLASTAFDAHAMLLVFNDPDASFNGLVDIGIGAAGSERVLLPDLYIRTETNKFVGRLMVPVAIPAGTRLSARLQADSTIRVIDVGATLFARGFLPPYGFQRGEVYGVFVSSTSATSVDPGATANTKGAWAQITGGISGVTTRPIRYLIAFISPHDGAQLQDNGWLVDFGIGASGQEKVLIPNIPCTSDNGDEPEHQQYLCLPCHIPAGARIACRAQSTSTDASDRIIRVALYGFG